MEGSRVWAPAVHVYIPGRHGSMGRPLPHTLFLLPMTAVLPTPSQGATEPTKYGASEIRTQHLFDLGDGVLEKNHFHLH